MWRGQYTFAQTEYQRRLGMTVMRRQFAIPRHTPCPAGFTHVIDGRYFDDRPVTGFVGPSQGVFRVSEFHLSCSLY
jgi:hypothetical protein